MSGMFTTWNLWLASPSLQFTIIQNSQDFSLLLSTLHAPDPEWTCKAEIGAPFVLAGTFPIPSSDGISILVPSTYMYMYVLILAFLYPPYFFFRRSNYNSMEFLCTWSQFRKLTHSHRFWSDKKDKRLIVDLQRWKDWVLALFNTSGSSCCRSREPIFFEMPLFEGCFNWELQL